jgi:hypothetical protein
MVTAKGVRILAGGASISAANLAVLLGDYQRNISGQSGAPWSSGGRGGTFPHTGDHALLLCLGNPQNSSRSVCLLTTRARRIHFSLPRQREQQKPTHDDLRERK